MCPNTATRVQCNASRCTACVCSPQEAAQRLYQKVLRLLSLAVPVLHLDGVDAAPAEVYVPPSCLYCRDYMVWADSKGKWHCFLDRCPHRLATLSDGFIDKQKDEVGPYTFLATSAATSSAADPMTPCGTAAGLLLDLLVDHVISCPCWGGQHQ